MGLFDKIFGRKGLSSPTPVPSAPSPIAEPDDAEPIEVFDEFGRPLTITRKDWRESILVPNLRKAWNDPEELARQVITALRDGFFAETLDAAARLAAIDPNQERGQVLHAILLLKCGRLDESEKTLRNFMARHGASGVVLTNLAKVHAERGEQELVLSTLWRALELDPNLDNAVGWFEVIHRESGGDAEGLLALRRIAALPGAWRARLWIARSFLEARNLDVALTLYQDALDLAPSPKPADMLMQISGDLGNHAHLPEILRFVAPHFDPEEHGIQVGNNLIKANLDLGRLDEARLIVDRLYGFKRPDWKATLSFWDQEIAKARVGTEPAHAASEIEVTLLNIEDAVWAAPDATAELFPARPEADTRIAVFCASITQSDAASMERMQMADAPGRLSRALPLFLSERLGFQTRARFRTLVPWMVAPSRGFLISGKPWPDDEMAAMARRADKPADYVLALHFIPKGEDIQLTIRLLRTIDAAFLGETSANLSLIHPGRGLDVLIHNLLALLSREADLEILSPPAVADPPAGPALDCYLLRLEQLLAARCAAMTPDEPSFLSGERDILDGCLQLCIEQAQSLPCRLVLLRTLRSLKQYRPAVAMEFQSPVEHLQKVHPLPEPAHGVLETLIRQTFKPEPTMGS